MSSSLGAVVLFAILGAVFLGFYMVVPKTYDRVIANVTDTDLNNTINTGYTTVLEVFNMTPTLLLVVAVIAFIGIFAYLRR